MYLVVGANGFLGSYVIQQILDQTEEGILATARSLNQVINYGKRVSWQELDVSYFPAIQCLAKGLRDIAPLKILYLAAYHHPDEVARKPQLAWHINVTCLSYFLNCFSYAKCCFYPSTEMVYGESAEGTPLAEDAELHPVNLYGEQKVVAEAIVRGYHHHVVRFPVLMGPSLLRHKKHFYDLIVRHLEQGESVNMFQDTKKSMLDFRTAARLLVRLTKLPVEIVTSILNVSGDEALSKYDVGLRIAEKHHADATLIHPISQSSDHTIFQMKRPQQTVLDNGKLKQLLGLSSIKMQYE